ncbi:signal transduction histidine kinase [Mycobacterium sp. OAS707]|uniref:ATP-binding protein n=1 Tax=Mycobacterium sp. OAS707 TaxID=2663822 RepID=UPI0019F6DDEA|nr:signal transduction histidine kinase [Mycobacterium sp. OAS707]
MLSLLVRPTAPPMWVGLLVAAAAISAETLLVVVLRTLAPMDTFGVVYLLGALVVAIGWGTGLAAVTSVVSAFGFGYFRDWPDDSFDPTDLRNWVVIGVFLVITLMANTLAGVARARAAEAERIAERQAALRRVATAVAQGLPAGDVFATVTTELAHALHAEHAALFRHEADGTVVLVAESGGKSTSVGRTAPIVVDGHQWGVAVVSSSRAQPLPSDTDARLADFARLVAMAIANAQARSDLTSSRMRIVTAADDARRRLERDLHDGAQQRLVSLALKARMTEVSLPDWQNAVREQLNEIVQGLGDICEELRAISRGIHPAILSKGGLGPALRSLACRSVVPVDLNVDVPCRLPDRVEVAAYYVVAEALTNTARHARADEVKIRVQAVDGQLNLMISDDGAGGADPSNGSGLTGLVDRVEAVGGHLWVDSPVGVGTSLAASIPCAA